LTAASGLFRSPTTFSRRIFVPFGSKAVAGLGGTRTEGDGAVDDGAGLGVG
jgi:hypothetical protein